jgi:hypothetical protein
MSDRLRRAVVRAVVAGAIAAVSACMVAAAADPPVASPRPVAAVATPTGDSAPIDAAPEPNRSPRAGGIAMDTALRDELLAAAVHFGDRPRPKSDAPAVLALPSAEFAREVCRDENIPCANVMAAYDPRRVRVVYRAELDLGRVWERSFVVHELVHWIQHQAQADTDADVSCPAYRAAEREAYTVQNRYLRHHQSGRRAGTMLSMLHC